MMTLEKGTCSIFISRKCWLTVQDHQNTLVDIH